jgi:hypothetical protein
LYLSLGNINSRIRNKPSHKCWILIAYIPIPTFIDPKSIHTALQQRLFHQCLKFVLRSIERAGKTGRLLRDSLGNRRLCYPRIAAYLADYPEQILINVAAGNNSPVTTARYHNLGDPKPHPRRTRGWILSRISEACQKVDPEDVNAYWTAAKELGLNAVDQPFWEDFPEYEPDLVICPDILHGLFRFWRDHILDWVQFLVGKQELDKRLAALQPIIGFRHFPNGIAHLSQWTGREDRELQRVLLAAIADAPNLGSDAIRCLRAFHNFLYLAQYRSHSTTTVRYMEQALDTFHSLKGVFIRNGARRGKNGTTKHFLIPKLSNLHMYTYHIPRMGTSVQFSTEITETCHQSMAKMAYKATNRKNFFVQMCAYLNRDAVLSLMEELVIWLIEEDKKRSGTSARYRARYSRDYASFVGQMAEAAKKQERLETLQASRSRGSYIWLTIRPDEQNMTIDAISSFYGLHAFRLTFTQFLAQYSRPIPVNLSVLRSDTWYRFRIQRPTVQDEDELADTRTVQAVPPPIQGNKYGRCSCVLIKVDEDAEETGIKGMLSIFMYMGTEFAVGYRVGQVRLIFQPKLPPSDPLYNVPLVYVYWFSKTPPLVDRDLKMYKVTYLYNKDKRRVGAIVPLSSVSRLVQLVPSYGRRINPELTMDNSMDIWSRYYINSFMDKEIYKCVW